MLLILSGALSLLAAPGARADQTALRNRISFQVERDREVANDEITAVLNATAEDRDAARVADRINEKMSAAVARAKAAEGVEVRTGGYRTVQLREPKTNRFRAWQGSQELILKTSEMARLAPLLGELQETLELVDIRFDVSPEQRRAVEAELVGEVLDAFRARAERVRVQLGGKGYQIVQIQLSSDGGGAPMPMMSRARTLAESVSPPVLEAGTRTLTSRASATIEIEF